MVRPSSASRGRSPRRPPRLFAWAERIGCDGEEHAGQGEEQGDDQRRRRPRPMTVGVPARCGPLQGAVRLPLGPNPDRRDGLRLRALGDRTHRLRLGGPYRLELHRVTRPRERNGEQGGLELGGRREPSVGSFSRHRITIASSSGGTGQS